MVPGRVLRIMVLLSICAALVAGSTHARTELSRPPSEQVVTVGPSLGWAVDLDQVERIRVAITPEVEGRVVARIEADWQTVEVAPGKYEWSPILAAAEALDRAGAVVILALTGTHRDYVPEGGPPSPEVAGSVEAWVEFARGAVRAMQGRALVFEIACADVAATDPEELAYVLKFSAIGIRAAARETGVLAFVAQAALPAGRLDLQARLWEADVAPYVDVLPVRFDRRPAGSAIGELAQASLAHPPAPAVWAYVHGPDAAAGALAALAAGATTAVTWPQGTDVDGHVRTTAAIQAALALGFAPAPDEAIEFRTSEGGEARGASLVASYFSDSTFESMIVVDPAGPRGETAPLEVIIPSAFVRNVRIEDPASRSTRRAAARAVEDDPRARSVRVVASGEGPVLIRYQAAAPLPEGVDAPDEQLAVDRTRGLTAEEIIARHQAVQKRQDDRLDRWTARAQIDFHFRFAQGGPTVDVAVMSRYFWERGGSLEWEQTEYFVNGNRIGWKKIPELPLIQPEKVITLPLDLTLDRTYEYRLAGEGRVDGRDAYVLTFEPVAEDPERSLYRGRVWIDRESFVRLKSAVVQTGLDVPVLSNEEVDVYRAVEGPDGFPFWMLSEIDGQQVWNTAGRNLVVRREVTFLSYELNPAPERFEQDRAQAYASDNQMLRDTEDGYRYLRREADGTRSVKADVNTSQLFALAGMFRDNSTNGVVPLAGVNWFNYRLGGKDVQTNVFFAGALGFGTLSVPNLFDRRLDVTLDVGLTAIKGEDRVYEAGEEITEQTIRTRTQRSGLRFGIPIGSFAKFNLLGAVNYVEFDDSDEGRDARPENETFVLPPDHRETSFGAEMILNRRGWEFEGRYRRFRRSEWSAWGVFDTSSGQFVDSEYDPSHQTFERWSATLRREWYLRGFHAIRAEASVLGGGDLDRFSEYNFGFFGDDRLFGFSGSGVRFDRGQILRAGYRFNVFEAVRFQASVDTARVRSSRDQGTYQRFTGAGLSANFVAPWRTIVNLDVGFAVDSDIPDLEGDFEVFLVVFKLF